MLTGIHFLLTYTCIYECDHCFLFCGLHAEGVFTIDQIREVLGEAKKLGTIESVYFEGGEPFLYYPVLNEGVRLSRENGFKTGIVTNCYWATAVEDGELWLGPLSKSGLDDISLSDDEYHNPDGGESPAKTAAKSAGNVGLPASSICIEAPVITKPSDDKGAPVIGGGALFKGRAVEKLTKGLPTRSLEEFTACEHEELINPKRVHVDCFGHVHVCQGISIGNMWEVPLSRLTREFDAYKHPICGPLSRGGPRALAQEYSVDLKGEFVDSCHYCFEVRKALISQFPEYLAPRQVYGLE